MNAEMKRRMADSIRLLIIEESCRGDKTPWPYWIPDNLHFKMADAAEAVFDSCQDGQAYMTQEANDQ
jgi:hypothetical protein